MSLEVRGLPTIPLVGPKTAGARYLLAMARAEGTRPSGSTLAGGRPGEGELWGDSLVQPLICAPVLPMRLPTTPVSWRLRKVVPSR
jgi:hypothetical protein